MSGTTRHFSVASCIAINVTFFGVMTTVFMMSPHARTAPWGFAGWLGVILSTLTWVSMAVFVSVLIGWLASQPEQPMAQMTGETLQGYVLFGGILLVLTWLLGFCELDATAPVSQGSTTAHVEQGPDPVNASLVRWKQKKTDLEKTQERLFADTRHLVQRLHAMGVHSRADIRVNPATLELVEELRELVGQRDSVTSEIERIESSVVRAESKIRRLQRREFVEGDEFVAEQELSRVQHELDEELRSSDGERSPMRELELDAFIEEHFGK